MGCRVCRARKVKCDGRPNGCRNCERLQLDCVADDGTATKHKGIAGSGSNGNSAAALRKIRTYRSCTNCRLSKTKCDGERPRCKRCAEKHSECHYDGGAAPRWARNLHKASASAGGGSGQRASSAEDEDARSSGGSSQGRSPEQQDVVMQDGPFGAVGSIPMAPAGSNRASSAGTSEGQYEDSVQTLVGNAADMQDSVHDYLKLAPSDPNAWLLSPNLPAGRQLRRIVECYFANIHPLRCFAFVHKPSFMRQLDKGNPADDEAALLHIVCAHGAKFYVLTQNEKQPDEALLSAAGNLWASRAEQLLLGNFGKITVQRLMTAILLHEFHFRAGEYTQALMISGLAVRMAHALKINTEYNSDVMCTESGDDAAPSVVSRESRRRLMWACYILDAWSGSGVDQLTLLRENDIKIQLPSNERNFGLRIASVTETLGVGHVLQFLPPSVVPRRPAANMGIMAYYIRIVTLWKKIVRYVNKLDSSTRPWLPESDFAALDADLRLWRRELPDFVEYSTETIYARLDSNQLGALVLIHCTYHHNYLELYKLSMPDLFKLSKPLAVPPDHVEFFQQAQENCYYHAHQIADILAEAADHGARLLSDSLLPYFVYDSSRVMLYYVARLLDPNRQDARHKVREAIAAVESNNTILRLMSALFPIAKSLASTIDRWLSKIRHASNREELVTRLQGEREPEIPGVEIPNPSLSSPGANPDLTLPSISLHSLASTAAGRHAAADGGLAWGGTAAAATTAESTETTPSATAPVNAPNSWGSAGDKGSLAAQQLLGLAAKDLPSPMRSVGVLQHERPVLQATNAKKAAQATRAVYEGLDLDDLQNFLSWDMYGIRDMGDPVSDGVEDLTAHSWAGAI